MSAQITPARSPGQRASVAGLLGDIAGILGGQEVDSAQAVRRLRECILILFNEFISDSSSRVAGQREICSVLKLTSVALDRYPEVFSDATDGSTLCILASAMPLLGDARTASYRDILCGVIRALLGHALAPACTAPGLFLRCACELLSDAFAALCIHSTHPGRRIILSGFQELCKRASRGAQTQGSQRDVSSIDFDASDPNQLLTIAEALCHLVSVVALGSPGAPGGPTAAKVAGALLPLATCACREVQVSAIDALAAIVGSYPHSSPGHRALGALAVAARGATGSTAHHSAHQRREDEPDYLLAESLSRCAVACLRAEVGSSRPAGVGALARALSQMAVAQAPKAPGTALAICDGLKDIVGLQPSEAGAVADLAVLVGCADWDLHVAVTDLLMGAATHLHACGALEEHAVATAFGLTHSAVTGKRSAPERDAAETPQVGARKRRRVCKRRPDTSTAEGGARSERVPGDADAASEDLDCSLEEAAAQALLAGIAQALGWGDRRMLVPGSTPVRAQRGASAAVGTLRCIHAAACILAPVRSEAFLRAVDTKLTSALQSGQAGTDDPAYIAAALGALAAVVPQAASVCSATTVPTDAVKRVLRDAMVRRATFDTRSVTGAAMCAALLCMPSMGAELAWDAVRVSRERDLCALVATSCIAQVASQRALDAFHTELRTPVRARGAQTQRGAASFEADLWDIASTVFDRFDGPFPNGERGAELVAQEISALAQVVLDPTTPHDALDLPRRAVEAALHMCAEAAGMWARGEALGLDFTAQAAAALSSSLVAAERVAEPKTSDGEEPEVEEPRLRKVVLLAPVPGRPWRWSKLLERLLSNRSASAICKGHACRAVAALAPTLPDTPETQSLFSACLSLIEVVGDRALALPLETLLVCLVQDCPDTLRSALCAPTPSPAPAKASDSEVALARMLRQAHDGAQAAGTEDTGRLVAVMRLSAALAGAARTAEGQLVPLALLALAMTPTSGVDAASGVQCRVLAMEMLTIVARRRGRTLRQLISGNDNLLEFVGRNVASRPLLLPRLAQLLYGRGAQSSALAAMVGHVALPRLVVLDNEAGVCALADVAGVPVARMVEEAIPRVLGLMFAEFSDGALWDKQYGALDRLSGRKVEAVLYQQPEKVVVETMLREAGRADWPAAGDLAVPHAQLRECRGKLETLVGLVGEGAGALRGTTGGLATVLAEKWLVGILYKIGNMMGEREVGGEPSMDGVRPVRCLCMLIDYISAHVAEHVPTFMTLLSRAAASPDAGVASQGLSGWAMLVRALGKHAREELRRVAGQVVVVMLPLLSGEGVSGSVPLAAGVLQELVVQHRRILGGATLQKLPPMPALAELQEVQDVLAAERRGMSPKARLELLVFGLSDDTLAVRHAALKELLCQLRDDTAFSRGVLEAMARSPAPGAAAEAHPGDPGRGPDDLPAAEDVAGLMSQLLRCFDGGVSGPLTSGVQLLAAECLGILGAWDPARARITMAAHHITGAHRFCVDDKRTLSMMKHLVVDHLVRILRTATDLETLTSCMYAVQEVFDIARSLVPESAGDDTSDGVQGSAGNPLLRLLPQDVHPVVRPFLTSKYQLKKRLPAQRGTVFGGPNHASLDFHKWLYTWLRQLCDDAEAQRGDVLRACSNVMKSDTALMLYLLPFAVHNVVTYAGAGARSDVYEEIVAVLRGAADTDPAAPPLRRAAGNDDAASAEEGKREMVGLAVQAVLSLVDALWAFVVTMQNSSNSAGPTGAMTANHASASTQRTTAPGGGAAAEVHVKQLLDRIPADLLARAAHRCGAHARALRWFEQHARYKGEDANGAAPNPASGFAVEYTREEAAFFQELFSSLDDPDSLGGLLRVTAVGASPLSAVATERMAVAEKSGHFSEALSLYEHAIRNSGAGLDAAPGTQQHGPDLAALHRGQLRCMLGAGQLQGVKDRVDGLSCRVPERQRRELAAFGVAAAWRLGHWEALDEYLVPAGCVPREPEAGAPRAPRFDRASALARSALALSDSEAFEVRIGELLSLVRRGCTSELRAALEVARREAAAPLSAASMESYSRAYPYLVRLHLLQELETSAQTLLSDKPVQSPGSLDGDDGLRWPLRLGITQTAMNVREPILSLRRQIASLAGLQDDVGQHWLQQARLAREAGFTDAASAAALEASARGQRAGEIELAKLLWAEDQTHRAIVSLQETRRRAQEGHAGGVQDSSDGAGRGVYANATLLLARWMADTGQGTSDEIEALFSAALSAGGGRWEGAHFHLGRYMDARMQDARKRQEGKTSRAGLRFGAAKKANIDSFGQDKPWAALVAPTLENYSKALKYGHSTIFRCLPRMLTVLFSYGADVIRAGRQSRSGERSTREARNAATAVTVVMGGALQSLPPYVWLAALPQLVSRICHPVKEVSEWARDIVCVVAAHFPQQALWSLAAVHNSKNQDRRAAAEAILRGAEGEIPRVCGEAAAEAFRLHKELVRWLINLCQHTPTSSKQTSFKISETNLREIFDLLPLPVILPMEGTLNVVLPPRGPGDASFDPFDGRRVEIVGVNDSVDLINSLMKPKKMTFLGSDGRQYRFLAKPRDDLRKDLRMMELANALNRLFLQEPESRRRGLALRTFAVVPLTEDCGLIEWVPFTLGFRHACCEVYGLEGLYDRRTSNKDIKRIYDSNSPLSGVRPSLWLNSVLRQFPPRMHRWFMIRYPEPAQWLAARAAFCRTASAWSMVGHVVGLGDRHGENLLLDSSSGDVVHVDFSCLFDKGLTLERPEVVPFRLTQNMIDVMGPAGHEGAFRCACETTLQVLRMHRETLLSVAETFVHDPFVDWSKGRGSSGALATEQDNPMARDALETMEGRLTGTLVGVDSTPSLPLSVEGHAHRLIVEATDRDKLGAMYIWWMPWF
ncbi:unnamed protein product [Pedinophyceae sp. YPF-701]|nr:unnamed protein product [Pedinophyceae sp. YPF-701]